MRRLNLFEYIVALKNDIIPRKNTSIVISMDDFFCLIYSYASLLESISFVDDLLVVVLLAAYPLSVIELSIF